MTCMRYVELQRSSPRMQEGISFYTVQSEENYLYSDVQERQGNELSQR